MSELIPQPHGGAIMPPPKKGEVRNPLGIRSAGRTIKEWINHLIDLKADEWKRISNDATLPGSKRIAALRLLRTIENPDLADFEEVVEGTEKLSDARKRGLDTTVIKKVKEKVRRIQQGEGEPITEIEREIELHDRSGIDFDRVMDRTEGKPNQSVSGADGGPVEFIVKTIRDASMEDV